MPTSTRHSHPPAGIRRENVQDRPIGAESHLDERFCTHIGAQGHNPRRPLLGGLKVLPTSNNFLVGTVFA